MDKLKDREEQYPEFYMRKNRDGDGQNDQQKRNVVCFKCNQKGHIKKNCRVNIYKGNQTVNQCDVSNINKTDQKYMVLNGYKRQVIFYTGSVISLIGGEQTEIINSSEIMFLNKPAEYRLVNGSKIYINQ
ncbi:hypothetical protein BDAP_001705 [Binucleata daphniae]